MNPKKQILKYIQKAYSDTTLPDDPEQRNKAGNQESSKEFPKELFDGMSSGTARIVIEQEMDRSLQEDYDIDRTLFNYLGDRRDRQPIDASEL